MAKIGKKYKNLPFFAIHFLALRHFQPLILKVAGGIKWAASLPIGWTMTHDHTTKSNERIIIYLHVYLLPCLMTGSLLADFPFMRLLNPFITALVQHTMGIIQNMNIYIVSDDDVINC